MSSHSLRQQLQNASHSLGKHAIAIRVIIFFLVVALIIASVGFGVDHTAIVSLNSQISNISGPTGATGATGGGGGGGPGGTGATGATGSKWSKWSNRICRLWNSSHTSSICCSWKRWWFWYNINVGELQRNSMVCTCDKSTRNWWCRRCCRLFARIATMALLVAIRGRTRWHTLITDSITLEFRLLV